MPCFDLVFLERVGCDITLLKKSSHPATNSLVIRCLNDILDDNMIFSAIKRLVLMHKATISERSFDVKRCNVKVIQCCNTQKMAVCTI